MIALTEHYTKQVITETKSDVEIAEAASKDANTAAKEVAKAFKSGAEKAEDGLTGGVPAVENTEYVYWPWRFLFNPRLQDDRATNFRNWTIGYLISVILAIILGVYVYACCLITCLEIEKVLVPGDPSWVYTHHFSLRPDIQHGPEQSLAGGGECCDVSHQPTQEGILPQP